MEPESMLKFELKRLSKVFGYGDIMQTASELWGEYLAAKGYTDGGVLVVGPCKAMTVPCGCELPHKCPWCNGAGWLTPHVKALKDGPENE